MEVLKNKFKWGKENPLALGLSETMEPFGHFLNYYLGPEIIR